MTGGIGAVEALSRGAGGVGHASGWLVNLMSHSPGLAPEDPPPQAFRPPPVTRLGITNDNKAADPTPAAPATFNIPAIIKTVTSPPPRKPYQPNLPLQEAGWVFPPLDLLTKPPSRITTGPSEEALQGNARLLETVLADYGVQGEIVEIRPGPVVTLYELVPAPGIRSARVIGLADDIARSLSVTAVRIATVTGRNVIGIEVPNSKRETVFLSEILSSDEVQKPRSAFAHAGQGYQRQGHRRRPGPHAAPDDRRHHGFGQIGRCQRDDSVAAVPHAA